jgi:hypothetical protein
MDQFAATGAHLPDEALADKPTHPAVHPHGKDRQALRGGPAEDLAPGFDDEMGRVAHLAELAGDGEDLGLALAPFAAGVNKENAHAVILT